MYVCMYVFIHIHTHIRTHTQTGNDRVAEDMKREEGDNAMIAAALE